MKLIASAVLALCTAAPAYAANTFACQNVKDYGALGNNATDDTAAVKSAFTAAAAGTIVENGTTISKGAACISRPACMSCRRRSPSPIGFPCMATVKAASSGRPTTARALPLSVAR